MCLRVEGLRFLPSRAVRVGRLPLLGLGCDVVGVVLFLRVWFVLGMSNAPRLCVLGALVVAGYLVVAVGWGWWCLRFSVGLGVSHWVGRSIVMRPVAVRMLRIVCVSIAVLRVC